MLRVSIICLAAFLANITTCEVSAEVLAVSESRNSPSHRIILFGASWCAPCIAELRNMAELAAAASPDQIAIVWADAGIRRFSFARYGNVEIASDAEARRISTEFASDNAGLPFAIMTDARGRKCAEWREALLPETIGRLRISCGR